ncbi:ABC-type transport auxiliary lipoprotein family protein [Hwanghaeella sp.]|uniref:ABC-type transport auxiliary lipoprotein family protein n=1 Tax=Hwanghaeella sp. TaxID=2605943 RepID=UPI003CCC0180
MSKSGIRQTGRRRFARTAALLCAAAVLLTGCALKLPGSGTPPRIFVLSPKSTFDEDLPVVNWQLLIDSPIAAAGLNSSRIALRQSQIELQYFANAAWTDAAPKMVQRLLIESFENSQKIVSVGRQAVGLRADFILATELREFQAEYEGKAEGTPPDVRTRINAKLVQMPSRTIVASVTYDYLIPAEGPELVSIVKAFDLALGKSLKRIVSWAITEGEKHHQN